MKILQLGKFYPPDTGGMETALYNITEELNQRGIQCDVLCANKEKKYRNDLLNGYKVIRTSSYGIVASTSISPQMIRELKKVITNYDILHIHHPNPTANLALFMANPKKQKVVIHWHSDIIKQELELRFYKPLLIWMLKKADVIIGTSQKYIDESLQLKDFKNKCVPIPIGIKKNDIGVDENKFEEIKVRFKNKKIIFSLGRFIYYKGFEYLIESAKYLPDNYVILLGGDGELKEKYEQIIRENGLSEKVFLVGKIDQKDLGSYYEACDLFCLPSIAKSEAFGLVMVEAMSFGKPIVATKIKGSGTDWVNHNEITGLNVEPKNPEQLANAFKTILENQEIYSKFSKNAFQRYLNEFTIETEIEKLIKVYRTILNN
ncbi:glycosyl transferase family 1 [Dysgonamonadaceae bacterium]|jgi:rhamnosyl/mannosyltransferase|nr:glycosyl transferase family 1 [Dysgonamonadaceae bacterium]